MSVRKLCSDILTDYLRKEISTLLTLFSTCAHSLENDSNMRQLEYTIPIQNVVKDGGWQEKALKVRSK